MTRSIGRACTRRKALSGPVRIGRGLDPAEGGVRFRLGCRPKPLCTISGAHTGGATPGSIPNPVVKPARAEGTGGPSPRESRSAPELHRATGPAPRRACGFPRAPEGSRAPDPVGSVSTGAGSGTPNSGGYVLAATGHGSRRARSEPFRGSTLGGRVDTPARRTAAPDRERDPRGRHEPPLGDRVSGARGSWGKEWRCLQPKQVERPAERRPHVRTVLTPREPGRKAKDNGAAWACKMSFTTGMGS